MSTPFHAGAEARLHLIGGRPTVILVRQPLEPTPAVLGRPGEIAVRVSIPSGRDWPDPTSAVWAAGALGQDGAVALIFDRLADAEACMARLTGKRPTAQGGRA